MSEERYHQLCEISNYMEEKVDKTTSKVLGKLFAIYPKGVELPQDYTFKAIIDDEECIIKGLTEDNIITDKGEEIDWSEASRWEFHELLHNMLFALEDIYLHEEAQKDIKELAKYLNKKED